MGHAEQPEMAGQDLTSRQRKIVQAIEDSMQRRGYSPTLREIGEAAGLASTSSVAYQLSRLEKKGCLSRGAGRPRTAVVRPLTQQQADRLRGDAEARLAQVPMVGRESDVENGDIVAATIESATSADREATVKTFRKNDGHVWLVPHNPAYAPILGDEAKILGKVVALLRRV